MTDERTSTRPTVVLVPGMWHRGAAWSEVCVDLGRRGLPSLPVTMPGRGRAPGDDTFTGHCAYLVDVLDHVTGPVVLVGHSYAGALLTEVGDRPNVRAMVFVAAFCLATGQSVGGVNDADTGSVAAANDIAVDGDSLMIDPTVARRAFYNGCPQERADAAVAALSPEHSSTRSTRMTREAWRTVPSHYVLCELDRAVPPAVQARMAAHCGAVTALPSGHSPMLALPHELCDVIAAVCDQITFPACAEPREVHR